MESQERQGASENTPKQINSFLDCLDSPPPWEDLCDGGLWIQCLTAVRKLFSEILPDISSREVRALLAKDERRLARLREAFPDYEYGDYYGVPRNGMEAQFRMLEEIVTKIVKFHLAAWPDGENEIAEPQGAAKTQAAASQEVVSPEATGTQGHPQRAGAGPDLLRGDPDTVKRRAVVAQNLKLSAQGLCELFDDRSIPLPKNLSECGTWAKAWKADTYRHNVESIISKDRQKVKASK
jgi:hypothetical protein